jgi:hypothetical protein
MDDVAPGLLLTSGVQGSRSFVIDADGDFSFSTICVKTPRLPTTSTSGCSLMDLAVVERCRRHIFTTAQ